MTLVTWTCAPPTWLTMLPQKFSAATICSPPPLDVEELDVPPPPHAATASIAPAAPSHARHPLIPATPSDPVPQMRNRLSLTASIATAHMACARGLPPSAVGDVGQAEADDAGDVGVVQAIEDEPAGAPRAHQAQVAEHAQVLRRGGRPQAEHQRD